MPKPRCILLDAGPIIGLHEHGLWDQFTQVFEVVVPEIICEQEALFHSVDSLSGFSEPIRLPKDAEDRRIDVASASGEAIMVVNHEVSRFVEIHDGETEALALLTQDSAYAEHVFCAADGAAFQAAALLGIGERCRSLEELLGMMGLTKNLEPKYTKQFADAHKKRGAEYRVYRE